MRSISSILVPVDFSAVAANTFQYALRFADRVDARIDLLHVIPPTTDNPGYGSFVSTLTQTLRDQAQVNMGDFLRQGMSEAAPNLKRVPAVECFIEIGGLRNHVNQRVERQDNQLIIMGTNGGYGTWDDLLGTNASFLVGNSPCPLLVVPKGVSYAPIQTLCYATDLNHADVFQAGNLLRALRPFDPAIHFFHVRPEKEETTEFDLGLLRSIFSSAGMVKEPTFVSRVGENVADSLFEYAEANGCDLVVMYRPEKSWFERLLIKSNTKEAALRATRPLLIVSPSSLREVDKSPTSVESGVA